MKRLLPLVFVLAPLLGVGQNAFPSYADSVSWNFYQCNSGWCITNTTQFLGDTVFCGEVYSIAPVTGGGQAYVRSDSVRTTFRLSPDCASKEYLMYDYSLSIGDTVYVGFDVMESEYAPDTTMYYVEDIDTVNYNGIDRKVLHMRYGRSEYPTYFIFEANWIYGIGSDYHPFFPLTCIIDYCESWSQTLCMDSSGVQLFVNPRYETCDTTNIGILDRDFSPLTLYPNPATTTVRIQLPEGTQRPTQTFVYDMTGRLIYQQSFTTDMDVSTLSRGTYAIVVHTEQGNYRGMIQKQ